MRRHIITDNYAPGDPESRYLCDVAARLAALLPDLQLTIPTGLGLRMLLVTKTITLADGFVINDIRAGHTILGEVEALLVVAALDPDPAHTYEWWATERWRVRDTDLEERSSRALLDRITRSPDVVRVS